MINIYSNNETVFTKNGLAVLEKIRDLSVSENINGEYSLSFTMPPGPKWQYVKCENILKYEGKLYRINRVEHKTVSAIAIYNDAASKHIQYIADMIGETPRNIMLALFEGTSIHIMTDAEVQALGMSWVTDATDFFEMSKTTPIGGLQTLMETLNKYSVHCELYVDNYNIALVSQIGKHTTVRIDTNYNAKTVEVTKDSSQLITRLYPYGKDDLHIDSVTEDQKQYIDSDNTSIYRIKEGFMQFDAIEDPAELLVSAKWQFSEDNPERIDVPQYSIKIDYVERQYNQVNLGDIIRVYDKDDNIETNQRVIAVTREPLLHKKTIIAGNPPENVSGQFDNLVESMVHRDIQTNASGELKTSAIEYMEKNENITIKNNNEVQNTALYKTGALWESPDGTSAVTIVNGIIAISNSKRNGKWYWSTIMNAGQMLVNEAWTGILYTNLVQLMGEGGKLDINNNLIIFKDSDDILRLKIGLSGSTFTFEMYDVLGNKTIYIDDKGDAVFKGKIEASTITSSSLQTNSNGSIHFQLDEDGLIGADSRNRKQGWSIEPNSNNIGGSLVFYLNGGQEMTIGRQAGNATMRFINTAGSIEIDADNSAGGALTLSGNAVYINGNTVYINGSPVATQEWVESRLG